MQDLIFSNRVIICWTEDLASFDVQIFKTFYLLIVIEPQETGLYRVKTFRSPDLHVAGPIQDEMILSKRILGATVRLTVLNASRQDTLWGNPYVN